MKPNTQRLHTENYPEQGVDRRLMRDNRMRTSYSQVGNGGRAPTDYAKTSDRGIGKVDPQFSPLSDVTHAKDGHTPKQPACGYHKAD